MTYKDFVKTPEQLKADLINDVRKQIVDTKLSIVYYQTEASSPKKMGKHAAEESVGLYQQHLKFLETKLKQYEEADVRGL